MIQNLITLVIRFDISKFDNSYGYKAWSVFWGAVDIRGLCNGTLFYEGDSAGTLRGLENIFCIAVQSASHSLIKEIRRKLETDKAFYEVAATVRFTEGLEAGAEPLVEAGRIVDGPGRLAGKAWNSRPALAKLLREKGCLASMIPPQQGGAVPDRDNPASPRTKNLPLFASMDELGKYCREHFSDPDLFKFYITPEELCDIAERCDGIFEVHWEEGFSALSIDVARVTFGMKGESPGRGLCFRGMFPFGSTEDALACCQSYGVEPAKWGIEGPYAWNFQGEEEEGSTSDGLQLVDPLSLWKRIYERRIRLSNPSTQGNKFNPLQRDEQTIMERDEHVKREVAANAESRESPTLCPHCGKAQPAGRFKCTACEGQLTPDDNNAKEAKESYMKFECEHCSQSLEAPSGMAGVCIDCPTCHKQITICF